MHLCEFSKSPLFPLATVCILLVGGLNAAFATQQDAATTEQQQADTTFDLLELRIKGNTLLPRLQLERTVYPFLGLKKSLESVEKARVALEEVYKAKGYQTVAVDIPEQDVNDGVVYLQVTEGKVSRLRVKESRYFSLGKIKAAVPELAEGKVPNMNVMQEQLAKLAAQTPDRKVTPILRAGEERGDIEVDLKVKDEFPLHARLELNGRNTATTSRLRVVSSLHYDNLWQKLHSASLMYQVSPENADEVDVWAGTYSMPFEDTYSLSFSAISSSSNSSISGGGAISALGIGDNYSLRLSKTLPAVNDFSHSLSVGVSYKNQQQTLNFINNPADDKTINYLPFLVQYNGAFKEKNYIAAFNIAVNFAVRGLANNQSQFTDKSSAAKANYAYLTAGLNFNHTLPKNFEFASRINGQFSDSHLIPYEQFILGGMNSIRGYFEAQAFADNGILGSLELRSPRLVPREWESVNRLNALVFIDGGKAWVKQASLGETKDYQLASAGFGVRFQCWKYFNGILDLGFPLISQDTIHSGDPKLHFSIATEF
ncbi:MAG: ShlB/FhaC/HecB family hemolysin secretion/activation protein [Methylococcaceae bacterium]